MAAAILTAANSKNVTLTSSNLCDRNDHVADCHGLDQSSSTSPRSKDSSELGLVTEDELVYQKSVAKKRSGHLERLLQRASHGSSDLHLCLQGQMCHLALSNVGCKILAAAFPHFALEHAEALLQELIGQVVYLGEHKYGSRAVVAMLEHELQRENTSPTLSLLLDECIREFDNLIYSVFGHRVLVVLMQRGPLGLKSKLIQRLLSHPHGLLVVCFNEDACKFVEVAMRESNEEDLTSMSQQLLSDGVESLTMFVHSLAVLAALLKRRSSLPSVRRQLREDPGNLATSKRGRGMARHYGINLD